MTTTDSPIYHKAFTRYLRHGIPIEISIKALKAEEHPTPYYIWHTAGDDRVRPSHQANEGRLCAWNDPPDTGHPGEAENCRCTAEPYYGVPPEPGLDAVYPELLLLSFLRIPLLIAAWRAWLLQRRLSETWRLGDHKSAQKWANRLEKGNWTPEKISRTIEKGEPHAAPNHVHPSNTATRYELDGNYVVVDDVTKEVLQVSGPDYIPSQI